MSKKPSYFDRLFIPNPCPADWNKMTGNDQMRYCADCNKHVYNLSKMTRDRAEALVARFEGQLCARFERGADGMIVTEEESSAVQLISRRASPVASAVVTAILSLSGSAVAATSSYQGKAIPIQAYASAKLPQSSDPSATLAGNVLDSQGAVIAGANVTLRNESTGEERTITSSDEGSFSFTSLAEGGYTLKVESTGFATFQSESLALKSGETTQLNPTLQVGSQGVTVTAGIVSQPSLPLRSLYDMSDLIVTARVGKSVGVKKQEDNAFMKTALDVSATLKGERKRSTVYVYHWGWGGDKTFPGGHTTGDKLLLFLKRSEEHKGYELIDNYYSVKKLPDNELDIYTQRIEELAAITRQAEPDASAITEWLVRCAEESATRWEGAGELAQETEQLNDDAEDVDDTDEASTEDAEPVGLSSQQVNELTSTVNKGDGNVNFAALLTDKQKDRLKSALYKTTEIQERDLELVQIVKTWKDKQLVPYLVWQLRQVEEDPPVVAAKIINIIAEMLNDEEITSLADEYTANATYEDLNEEEVDVSEAAGDESEPDEDEDEDVATEKIDAATAKQQRSEMVKKFLAAVEKKMLR